MYFLFQCVFYSMVGYTYSYVYFSFQGAFYGMMGGFVIGVIRMCISVMFFFISGSVLWYAGWCFNWCYQDVYILYVFFILGSILRYDGWCVNRYYQNGSLVWHAGPSMW